MGSSAPNQRRSQATVHKGLDTSLLLSATPFPFSFITWRLPDLTDSPLGLASKPASDMNCTSDATLRAPTRLLVHLRKRAWKKAWALHTAQPHAIHRFFLQQGFDDENPSAEQKGALGPKDALAAACQAPLPAATAVLVRRHTAPSAPARRLIQRSPVALQMHGRLFTLQPRLSGSFCSETEQPRSTICFFHGGYKRAN